MSRVEILYCALAIAFIAIVGCVLHHRDERCRNAGGFIVAGGECVSRSVLLGD